MNRLRQILLSLGLAVQAAFAAAPPPAPPVARILPIPPVGPSPIPPDCRFLFVVDTSSAMQRQADGLYRTTHRLIANGLGGRMQDGDIFTVWTYADTVLTREFPLNAWTPDLNIALANRAYEFLAKQKFRGKSNLRPVFAELGQALAIATNLTIVLVSDGTDVIVGTPFDRPINVTYGKRATEMSTAKMPFITSLVTQHGEFTHWSVRGGLEDIGLPLPERPVAATPPLPPTPAVVAKVPTPLPKLPVPPAPLPVVEPPKPAPLTNAPPAVVPPKSNPPTNPPPPVVITTLPPKPPAPAPVPTSKPAEVTNLVVKPVPAPIPTVAVSVTPPAPKPIETVPPAVIPKSPTPAPVTPPVPKPDTSLPVPTAKPEPKPPVAAPPPPVVEAPKPPPPAPKSIAAVTTNTPAPVAPTPVVVPKPKADVIPPVPLPPKAVAVVTNPVPKVELLRPAAATSARPSRPLEARVLEPKPGLSAPTNAAGPTTKTPPPIPLAASNPPVAKAVTNATMPTVPAPKTITIVVPTNSARLIPTKSPEPKAIASITNSTSRATNATAALPTIQPTNVPPPVSPRPVAAVPKPVVPEPKKTSPPTESKSAAVAEKNTKPQGQLAVASPAARKEGWGYLAAAVCLLALAGGIIAHLLRPRPHPSAISQSLDDKRG